jgi:multicomponent Na+:H+ antiporter subunit E
MHALLWNLLLALAWVAATGVFTFNNLASGIIIGFVVMFITRRIVGEPRYVSKTSKFIGLLLFFLWELILANLRVAYDVLTPRQRMRPGVIAIPLEAKTDAEITILSNLITLTPGTLSLDVSEDRKVLYIHAMYLDDIEATRAKIKNGFERRLLEVMR